MSTEAAREKALQQYRALMSNIRARFDVIDTLKLNEGSEYARLETGAFHLRKAIEGVAFACLVAMENGLREVPRDARGQWNADRIFAAISKQRPDAFPFAMNSQEPQPDAVGVQHHVTLNEAANISIDGIREIYRATHWWLHEVNPYLQVTLEKFSDRRRKLLSDIVGVWGWLLHHMIVVEGEVLFSILKNEQGDMEVFAASANVERAA